MKFLKKLGTKIKVIFGVLIGIIGFIVFLFIDKKVRAKDKLKYELSKVESEINIANLEKDSEEKEVRIENLKKEEALIREKISFIEKKEVEEGVELTTSELDDFFDNRGF